MSQRVPRPIRLLNHRSCTSVPVGSVLEHHSPLIAAYKPCGLPYFARSQLQDGSATVNASSGERSSKCGGGRHLFSASPHCYIPISCADVSDSLLSRITDQLPPGAGKPRIALPLAHPALVRYATAEQLNTLTALRKGTTLVAPSPQEFMFLRNCHRLGLVRFVYRVLCHLPPCVAARARESLERSAPKEQNTRHRFKNPYVRQMVEAQGGSIWGTDSDGIYLGGSLPRCALPETLLKGGFYNLKSSSLLRHGTVSGYIGSSFMSEHLRHAVQQQERLKGLFFPNAAREQSRDPTTLKHLSDECELCRCTNGKRSTDFSHPWVPDRCRLCVSFDARTSQVKYSGLNSALLTNYDQRSSDGHASTVDSDDVGVGTPAAIGKAFRFDFRLIKLNDKCDVAMYEVSTSNASDEEIKVVFASANLPVLNDHVNDKMLAEAVSHVTKKMHGLPQSKIAHLPLALQQSILNGTPDELVVLPLLLPCSADNSGPHGQRYRLLLETLAGASDERVYDRVLRMVLGSGLECGAVHFPDGTDQSTACAVQYLLTRMEESDLVEAHRSSVAEQLSYASCGTTSDCETYAALLSEQDDRLSNGSDGNDKGSLLNLPKPQDLLTAWGGVCTRGLRKEELGDFFCSFCGATGHLWSSCPHGTPLIEAVDGGMTSNNVDGAAGVAPGASQPGVIRGGSDAGIFTVDDVADALSDARVSHRNDENIVTIPNVVPTKSFNHHAWRRNEERPKLHRSHLRCAYCSGRHHVTQCSKLFGNERRNGEMSYDDSAGDIEPAKLKGNEDRLFCIKCGQHGHLYAKCPKLPVGLHTSVTCPICLLSRSKSHHNPSQCPRRVSAPVDYTPSGIPLTMLQPSGNEKRKGSARRRAMASSDQNVLLSDSFLLHSQK